MERSCLRRKKNITFKLFYFVCIIDARQFRPLITFWRVCVCVLCMRVSNLIAYQFTIYGDFCCLFFLLFFILMVNALVANRKHIFDIHFTSLCRNRFRGASASPSPWIALWFYRFMSCTLHEQQTLHLSSTGNLLVLYSIQVLCLFLHFYCDQSIFGADGKVYCDCFFFGFPTIMI